MGAIRTCSQVPRSFSRTTEIAVEMAATIMPMKPMRPGTRKSVLRSSGLNQMRGSTDTGGWSAAPRCWTSRSVDTPRTIVSE